MAGSYKHLVDHNNTPYEPFMDLIENMRDARGCIEELFAMVQYLSGGDKRKIWEAHNEGYCKNAYPHYDPSNPVWSYENYWRSA